MNILALSGWGQPHDALECLASGAVHVDYARHADITAALLEIEQAGRGADAVIGWSLGGQLAMRAIAAGRLQPKRLVLIAAPVRFVAAPVHTLGHTLGMKRDLYDTFRHNWRRNPERTLRKAWELVVKDDDRESDVRTLIAQHDMPAVLSKNWLDWLDILGAFDGSGLDMGRFPPTLLVHGQQDVVVDVTHSRYMAQRLPEATLIELPGCGHAPHWHNPDTVMAHIREHIKEAADV